MGGSTRKVTRKSKKEQRKQICKPGLREKPNVTAFSESGVERLLGKALGISIAKPMLSSGACHNIPQGAHTPKTKVKSPPG